MLKNIFKKPSSSFLPDLSIPLIDRIFDEERVDKKEAVDEVMAFDASQIDFVGEEERAFPGNPAFVESGYYRKMLKRYLFAGKRFCENKVVLDSCSGLGWGTYLISHYAQSVTAFDFETQAIHFSEQTWRTRNVSWRQGDALSLPSEWQGVFDTALGMETIEHFTREDGRRYVENIASALKPGGYFVGTSSFPSRRRDADRLCRTNPYHLYIHTEKEMSQLLAAFFEEHVILKRWMFVARKKH